MIIRQADERDGMKVYQVVNSALDDYFAPEVVNFFQMQWPGGQFIAEDLLGNPVGAICGSRLDGNRAAISLFAVSPGYQGRGIGGRLLESFCRRCMMEGLGTVQLEVRCENVRAISFYERNGFRRTELLPAFYNDGGDGYRMVRSGLSNRVIS